MSVLSDQAERDRFTSAYGKNISVIAPAGVGKTHAIVQRIIGIATQPQKIAVDQLQRLIVVTYSVRAAQQMQQRARAAIRKAGVTNRVQRAFQQTFFGTIHSYCVRLLDRFGHHLGLPSPVGLLQNHDEWWERFLVRGLSVEKLAGPHFEELFHFYPTEKLYGLGKEISPGDEIEVGPSPALNLEPILTFKLDALHHSTKRSLGNAQAQVVHWRDAWARGDRFHPLPKCPETKTIEFVEIWRETFAPLHEWLCQTALAFGRKVANAYETFRVSQAVMTYDDQVRIAFRLLDLPAVQEELAQERPSVLLDEAQDTDRTQFEVLRRVAGLAPGGAQAADQSFCIVGDFQQAIYAPRSDLGFYRQVHDELIIEPRGGRSQLEVTFRCDKAIIRFVNRIFPAVLNGAGGQSEFFPLRARDDAGPGEVARWSCPDEPQHGAGIRVKAEIRARHEAMFLAQRMSELSFEGLGATSWSQVAILCPRRNWLLQIARELKARDIPVQFHSGSETQNDRTPGTWLTSLIWVAAHPEDSFEVTGVLREIFGVSDHDLANFTQGEGERLRLDRAEKASQGAVTEALGILREAIKDAEARPLHEAVERLVEKTELRARLAAIGEFEPEGVEDDLEDLLATVYARAASGTTLADLAKELRLTLVQSSPVEEEVREAVQLLTSHKSKGLEWQTVIMPYVFRPIETRTSSYPRLEQGEGGREMIFRDKADYDAQARTWVTERERQQLQRLLYVTCTRAKLNLLLIDDEALFDGQMQRGGWSSAELLGFLGGVNRVSWEALPDKLLSELRQSKFHFAELLPEPKTPPGLSEDDFQQALRQAAEIPRRMRPHALALHPAPEAEPEEELEREEEARTGGASNAGILYGLWWHEVVEGMPWSEGRTRWREHFEQALGRSPQRERSMVEWDLFENSALAERLAEPGLLIQREIPFLWLEQPGRCLEGVIDLAVCNPEEGSWEVIDWKTNRRGEGLVEIYRGQIEAYVRALREMLQVEVRGSLYATGTGEWIRME